MRASLRQSSSLHIRPTLAYSSKPITSSGDITRPTGTDTTSPPQFSSRIALDTSPHSPDWIDAASTVRSSAIVEEGATVPQDGTIEDVGHDLPFVGKSAYS